MKRNNTVVSCHTVPVLKATVNSDMTMYKGLDKPWNRDEPLDVVIAPVVQDLNVYSIAREDS